MIVHENFERRHSKHGWPFLQEKQPTAHIRRRVNEEIPWKKFTESERMMLLIANACQMVENFADMGFNRGERNTEFPGNFSLGFTAEAIEMKNLAAQRG